MVVGSGEDVLKRRPPDLGWPKFHGCLLQTTQRIIPTTGSQSASLIEVKNASGPTSALRERYRKAR